MTAMEERLNVPQSSRFPLYKQLMWHAAAFYADCLEAPLPAGQLAISANLLPIILHAFIKSCNFRNLQSSSTIVSKSDNHKHLSQKPYGIFGDFIGEISCVEHFKHVPFQLTGVASPSGKLEDIATFCNFLTDNDNSHLAQVHCQ